MSISWWQRGLAMRQQLWELDTERLPWWQAFWVKLLRVICVFGGVLTSEELSLRALSLVYTTLLSLVPLLALAFSVLKGFGVHNELEPALLNFLQPLGDKGVELTHRIIGFVENVNVGVLGSLGLVLLLYTVISLLAKVEQAFNFIWQVERARHLTQRISEYISVLLIGPVLVFSALGLTASLLNSSWVQRFQTIEAFGTLVQGFVQLLPYLLVIAAFTFVYIFMPNTRVRFLPALLGGLVGGTLWQTLGWLFSLFIVHSTNYTAIYSSFAILVFFLIWLQVSWLVLLFGASVAFHSQNPQSLLPGQGRWPLSNQLRERVGLMLMFRISKDFYLRHPPPGLDELARWIKMPIGALQCVLQLLERQGLVIQAEGEERGYVPAYDLERMGVLDLLHTLRQGGENDRLSALRLHQEPVVDDLLAAMEEAAAERIQGLSLRALVLEAMADAQPQAETAPGPDSSADGPETPDEADAEPSPQ